MRNGQPLTLKELKSMTTPAQIPGQNMEVIPYQLFDTAALATGDTSVEFFTVSRNNRNDTNLGQPRQLPNPQYLQVNRVMVELFTPIGTALATADPFAQMQEFLRDSKSSIQLNIQDKNYGRYTLTAAAGGNGPTGFGFAEAATAGTLDSAYANAGMPGSSWGFPVNGLIVIPPTVDFYAAILSDALDAILDGLFARVSLIGYLYRAIV